MAQGVDDVVGCDFRDWVYLSHLSSASSDARIFACLLFYWIADLLREKDYLGLVRCCFDYRSCSFHWRDHGPFLAHF